MSPRWSRLRKLAWIVGLSLVALMVAGFVMKAPPANETSSYCGPLWHPEVYCTPGYVGPLYRRAFAPLHRAEQRQWLAWRRKGH